MLLLPMMFSSVIVMSFAAIPNIKLFLVQNSFLKCKYILKIKFYFLTNISSFLGSPNSIGLNLLGLEILTGTSMCMCTHKYSKTDAIKISTSFM